MIRARSASVSKPRRRLTGTDGSTSPRQVEDNGYDVLTMPDHFGDQLAPVPALMTAADATDRRCESARWSGTTTTSTRVVLAKELATMDLLSEGRVEIGIGAGWMISDYEAVRIPTTRPRSASTASSRALAIIKERWAPSLLAPAASTTRSPATTASRSPFRVRGPPILIGGGGQRVLRFAAREADIIGINGTMTAGVVGPGRSRR